MDDLGKSQIPLGRKITKILNRKLFYLHSASQIRNYDCI